MQSLEISHLPITFIRLYCCNCSVLITSGCCSSLTVPELIRQVWSWVCMYRRRPGVCVRSGSALCVRGDHTFTHCVLAPLCLPLTNSVVLQSNSFFCVFLRTSQVRELLRALRGTAPSPPAWHRLWCLTKLGPLPALTVAMSAQDRGSWPRVKYS